MMNRVAAFLAAVIVAAALTAPASAGPISTTPIRCQLWNDLHGQAHADRIYWWNQGWVTGKWRGDGQPQHYIYSLDFKVRNGPKGSPWVWYTADVLGVQKDTATCLKEQIGFWTDWDGSRRVAVRYFNHDHTDHSTYYLRGVSAGDRL